MSCTQTPVRPPSQGPAYIQVDPKQTPAGAAPSACCAGFCCFKGCLFGTVGLTYFFVVLPAGILLVFHGLNNSVSSSLGAGAAVLVIPTCLLPSLLLAYRWRHIQIKDTRRAERARKRGYENPNPQLEEEL